MTSSGGTEQDRSAMSDVELVRAIQKGDLGAFAALVARHQRPLINFFYHQSWDRQIAEDCAQEVFLKLYTRLGSYEPHAKFTTFLFRVAKNHWIDKVRAAKSRPTRVSLETPIGHGDEGILQDRLPGRAESPVETMQRQEIQGSLRAAIDQLPDEQRMVVILSEFQGLRYIEIGEILDIPVGTVKSRMHTAVDRLRGILSQDEV